MTSKQITKSAIWLIALVVTIVEPLGKLTLTERLLMWIMFAQLHIMVELGWQE